MTERVVSFGPAGRLVGVLCEPEPDVAVAGAPTILTWNVGVNHHVGPYRFFVDLSRGLARHGFSSLRFDLSGLGDSAVRTDATLEKDRAVDDVNEAMTFLERRDGRKRFILVGFCSSVDAAHRIAVGDERVAAVCFIEGYAYRTPGFFARYPLRFLEPARWRRIAARRMPAPLRGLPVFRQLGRFATAFADQDRVFVRDYPDPRDLRRDYETMSARGARQLFVYIGGDSSYNHEGQLREFLGLQALPPTMEVAFLPDADHTLFRVVDREALTARIAAWTKG